MLQDLVGQVVEDEPVVARELADERGRIASSLHRQRSELQGGDPAFGTRFEHVDISGGQGQVHCAVQVLGSFVGREAQVGSAHLDQSAVRP